MAGNSETPASWPKILLAKPGGSRAEQQQAGGVKLMRDRDDENAVKARFPQGSLNLLTDAWDFSPDRVLPLMSEHSDFTVVGVLGLPGAGKSTIMNELYGYDGNIAGVPPPFPVQTDDIKAQARHCSTGIELRVSPERFILLDTQPVFSSSVLMDLTRPDGSSTLQPLGGDAMTAELAHELMAIQLAVFLTSVCHVVLLVTDGLHDTSLWQLVQTVEMLKQGIPDPSVVGQFTVSTDDMSLQEATDFCADPVFVHTKLRDKDLSLTNIQRLKVIFTEYFKSSTFRKTGAVTFNAPLSSGDKSNPPSEGVSFFLLPRMQDDAGMRHFESFQVMLHQLRNQILSMPKKSFGKSLNERDWLRNAARVWDLVKKSTVIADYGKMLQSSGLFRR